MTGLLGALFKGGVVSFLCDLVSRTAREMAAVPPKRRAPGTPRLSAGAFAARALGHLTRLEDVRLLIGLGTFNLRK